LEKIAALFKKPTRFSKIALDRECTRRRKWGHRRRWILGWQIRRRISCFVMRIANNKNASCSYFCALRNNTWFQRPCSE